MPVRAAAPAAACLALAATLLVPGTASAQAWPSRPIRLVVPFPSGGTIDLVGRIVAQGLGERVGQSVVVDNRGGAGGMVGVDLVVKAAPDGHTLCLCSAGAMMTSPLLVAKPPYDALRDLAPVTMVATVPYVLLVRPGGTATLKELLATARQKPGTLNYGSAGAGSSSHLAAALFASMAGIDVVHVAYKGSAQAATELVGGQIQFVFEAIGFGAQYAKSGRLRALGVSTPRRSAVLPDVPTIAEAGVPGYDMATWHTVTAPRGTPEAVVARLNREIVAALSAPEVRERFTGLGTEPATSTPAELRDRIALEQPRWAKLLGDIGLRPK